MPMLNSIKSWLNLPVQIKPFLKRDGTGDKSFGATINTFCYAEGKVVVVTNDTGTESISTKQLYLDGTEIIAELDCVVFEGRESDIKSVSTFYRNGKADIKVVYL